MDLPLTTFEGALKQIDAARLSPRERLALEVALPHFLSSPPPAAESMNQAAERRFLDAVSDARDRRPRLRIEWQSAPNRRFAGGPDLPRGRYYTVARDPAGDDDSTLAAEMSGYRSVRRSALCAAIDSFAPSCISHLCEHRPSVILAFLGDPELIGPASADLVERLDYPPITTLFPIGPLSPIVALCVEIRCITTSATISDVLDLRTVAAQEWFFERFALSRDGPFLAFEEDQPTDFTDMLPWLLTMELGGGGFTEAVGDMLRRHGVNALIYPSARTDSYAMQVHRQPDRHGGWCLVDYRGAPTPSRRVFDATSQTPFPFAHAGRIRYWPDPGRDQGSWAVEDVRSHYQTRAQTELGRFVGAERAHVLSLALDQLEGAGLRAVSRSASSIPRLSNER